MVDKPFFMSANWVSLFALSLLASVKFIFVHCPVFIGVRKIHPRVQKGNQRGVWLLLDVGCVRRER